MSPRSNYGTYYIIEHPRRGTFREMDSDWRAGKRIDIPRFSSTGNRNDSDKALQFRSFGEAIAMVRRIIASDERMRKTLTLRRSPDFKKYCPECKGWIDEFMQAQNGHTADCSRR
jgi:hypothetical protein